MAQELAGYVQSAMELLVRNEQEIRKQNRAALSKLNEPVHFRQGSRSFTGTVATGTSRCGSSTTPYVIWKKLPST